MRSVTTTSHDPFDRRHEAGARRLGLYNATRDHDRRPLIAVDRNCIRPTIDLISLLRPHAALDIDDQRRQDRAVHQQKASATILAFVEPLFLSPAGPPPEKFEQILRTALLVWNAVILDDHHGTDYLSQARAQLQLIDDPRGRQLMLALVDDFADRKRQMFAQDLWLVGDWKILDRDKREPRLQIMACDLEPPHVKARSGGAERPAVRPKA